MGTCFLCEDEEVFNDLGVGKFPWQTSDLNVRQAVPPSQREQ